METKWTTGPWKAEVTCNDHGRWKTPTTYVTINGGKNLVAHFDAGFDEYGSDELIESNDKLIAAAPDLYSALDRMAWQFRNALAGRPVACADETIMEAENAMRKARGES